MGERALNSPVRRIDVLERVKSEAMAFDDLTCFGGLCSLLAYALRSYGLIEDCISFQAGMDALKKFFPLYTHDNAVEFGARSYDNMSEHTFWWPSFVWDEASGRMRFLNWLIVQYKDDKTDLRTIILKK